MTADRFTTLWQAHHRPVLAYLLRRVDQPADAADLLSETFLIAWRRPSAVPEGREALLWLYRVAANTLANDRRRVRRHARLVGELTEALLHLPAVPPPSADVLAVRVAVSALPESDRDVIRLSAWEGLTSAEIAVVLDLTPEAVRARLSRARARLREALACEEERPQSRALA